MKGKEEETERLGREEMVEEETEQKQEQGETLPDEGRAAQAPPPPHH